MLVCPQCQFHNADINKFCQQCGTTLTETICAGCEQPVPFDLMHCPACGEATGKVWWALLYPTQVAGTQLFHPIPIPEETDSEAITLQDSPDIVDPDANQVLPQPEIVTLVEDSSADVQFQTDSEQAVNPMSLDLGAMTTQSLEPAELTTTVATPAKPQYLDQAQRYRLLTSVPAGATAVPVLDCQPYQLSLLNVIQQQLQATTPPLDFSQPQVVRDYLAAQHPQLPEMAYPYLALQVQFPQNLSALHDAWTTEQHVVLLLEDQSSLTALQDCWQDEDLPPLQILYWLRKILTLWQALLPWGCAQSLLMLSNLRVNADLRLQLRQLLWSSDLPDLGCEPTLADLLHTWTQLFEGCSPERLTTFATLLSQLDPANAPTLADIQATLNAETTRLQPPEPIAGKSPQVALPSFTAVDDSAGGNVPTILLPNQLIKLEAFGRTDVGRDRHHNEDFFIVHNQIVQVASPEGQQVQAQGIFILCDGMGGHAQGEVASSLAANTLIHYFQLHWSKYELPSNDTIAAAIYLANQTLFQGNEDRASAGSDRMGTTLVMVLIQDTQVRVAHVGDSRLYRLTRSRGLEQITLDHEVGQREIGRGVNAEVAYARPDAYQLTQALGPRGDNSVQPEIQSFTLEEDAVLLLASDGLTDNELIETYRATHIQPLLHSRTDLEQGVDQLIDLANEHNGHDNITAIAIRMKVRPQLAPTLQTE